MGKLCVTQPPKQLADATYHNVSPASATWYTVLNTTRNLRIINAAAAVAWAVTQPTPLEIKFTIDGLTINFARVNPVNGTWYEPYLLESLALVDQPMIEGGTYSRGRTFFLEARSIKIEVRTTIVTGVSALDAMVRHARY